MWQICLNPKLFPINVLNQNKIKKKNLTADIAGDFRKQEININTLVLQFLFMLADTFLNYFTKDFFFQ